MVETDWGQVPLAARGSIAFSGVFALFIGNFLWIWGVGKVGSIKASIYNKLSPVFSIIAAYLLLGETFGLLQSFGATVIFLGLCKSRKNEEVKKKCFLQAINISF